MKKLYATFLIIACTLVSLPCNAQAEWKNDFSKQGEILKEETVLLPMGCSVR